MPAIVDTSLVSDLLIEDVEPSVNDQLGYESILHAMVQKNFGVTPLDNYNYKIAVRTGRSSGNYGITESVNNVVYGSPQYDETIITAKTLTTAFKLTHQSLAIKNNGMIGSGTFDQVTSDVTSDYIQDWNRMAYGVGDGALGTAASTTSGTTFVFAASANDNIDAAEYCPEGTFIKIGATAVVEVTAVTAKNTITIASSRSWTAGDSVVRCDSAGNASVEITGFGAIFGTGSFQNLSSPLWKADLTNLGAALSAERNLTDPFLKNNARRAKTRYIICNYSLFSDYASLLTSQKRVMNSTDPLNGGWAGIEFMGGKADLVLDSQATDDRFFGVDPSALSLAELAPFEFLKTGGNGVTLNHIPGTLNYEVIGVHITDLAVKSRNKLWALTGVDKM